MVFDSLFKKVQNTLSISKDVEILGIKFKFGLLTFDESQRVTADKSSKEQENEQITGDDFLLIYKDAMKKTLSYSIKAIDDQELPAIVEVVEGDKSVTKERALYLRELLDSLAPTFVEKLFDVYLDFKEEVDERVSKETKYDWFKDPSLKEEKKEAQQDDVVESEDPGERGDSGEPDQPKPEFRIIKEKPEDQVEEEKDRD